MKKPEPAFEMPLVRPWRIRRPYVFRYLEKQFVDAFFESGSLRLSSFAKFSRHKDEQRFDPDEGYGMVFHRNHEGTGQTLETLLPGISQAFLRDKKGHALMSRNGSLIGTWGRVDLNAFKVSPESNELDGLRVASFLQEVTDDELMFLKQSRFAHQSEYRFLWHIGREIDGHLDIVCPEARQNCSRFEGLLRFALLEE